MSATARVGEGRAAALDQRLVRAKEQAERGLLRAGVSAEEARRMASDTAAKTRAALAFQALDHAERLVLDGLPADGTAVAYERATEIPGLTAHQARWALLGLVGQRHARCWTEIQGLTLVARGPFVLCDACAKINVPGRRCGPPNYRYARGSLIATGSEGPSGCGFDPRERAS